MTHRNMNGFKGDLLLLGMKFDVVERAKKLGYRPILVNYEPHPDAAEYFPLSSEDGRDERYDLGEFAPFFTPQLRGIVVCYEDYVKLGARLREKYRRDLKGLSLSQASIVRDKWLLKSKLTELGIPTTRFCLLDENSILAQVRRLVGFPFLLKPREEAASQGIRVIRREEDWLRAKASLGTSLDQYIAEEFLENLTEHCCDTIVANGKILAQFPGDYSVSCLESRERHDGIGVDFPGFLPEEEIAQMKSLSVAFIRGLGIEDGFCHIEFLRTPDKGLRLGEMGCRLPGGYQLPAESLVAGESIIDLYLRIFAETEPTPSQPLSLEGKFGGYFAFPKKPGFVTSIQVDFNRPWIAESGVHVREGDFLPPDDTSFTLAAHVMYQGSSREELQRIALEARDLVRIEYQGRPYLLVENRVMPLLHGPDQGRPYLLVEDCVIS